MSKQQAANFFKFIALSVTLNEYYEYLKQDLIELEMEAYQLNIDKSRREVARKLIRDKPKFLAKLNNDYNRLPKLLNTIESKFAKDYDEATVQLFIDTLHSEMEKIEVEVVK